MQKETCRLPASGFTETLNEVYDWANAVVAQIKKTLPDGPIKVFVWGYREQGSEWLSVDFSVDADKDRYYWMTFLIGEEHTFDLREPYVPDMTEALHMVGILADALGAAILLGRRGNEVNPYCTPEKWQPGQTSARLALTALEKS